MEQNYIFTTTSHSFGTIERKYLTNPELNYWASNKNKSQVISVDSNSTTLRFFFADKHCENYSDNYDFVKSYVHSGDIVPVSFDRTALADYRFVSFSFMLHYSLPLPQGMTIAEAEKWADEIGADKVWEECLVGNTPKLVKLFDGSFNRDIEVIVDDDFQDELLPFTQEVLDLVELNRELSNDFYDEAHDWYSDWLDNG